MIRGRFAPSPTGPLHFGSLVAATASFLHARARGGEWLVRIEDLDAPREKPGAADDILRTLEAFGFSWDGPVVRQSHRLRLYEGALERLRAQGTLYGCGCSRREIADSSIRGIEGFVYPGTCRRAAPPAGGRDVRGWRVRVEDRTVAFDDLWQGRITRHLGRDYGDFIVRRADGWIAYQLAVVVDDAAQGVTEVVRGADLIESTPRQIFLQQCLGLPTPRYAHCPVAVKARGEKLSKQDGAVALDDQAPVAVLTRAMRFLGHVPSAEVAEGTLDDFWRWALGAWDPAVVPRAASREAHAFG